MDARRKQMKNKKMGFTLLLILIFALVAGACSSNTNNAGMSSQPADSGTNPTPQVSEQPKPDNSATEQAAQSGPLFDEKKTFTFMVRAHNNWTYSADKPLMQMLEKRTNVKIDPLVQPLDNYDNNVNLAIASGDLPDIIYMSNVSTANKFGLEGALTNILDYIDVMPNFKQWLTKYPEITNSYIAADGGMYMFPNQGLGEGNRVSWFYREDVFKKHNLSVPKTYDELYDVLKELKKLYPDSYPLTTREGNLTFLRLMAAQFDTFHYAYYDYDKNEWRYGPTEDNFKTMLEYLNKFYKEGLIAPDFLTMTIPKWEEMVTTDKTFISVDYLVMDTYNIPMREKNPDYNLAFMAPPAGGPNGKQANFNNAAVWSGQTVSSTTKQAEDIMKYMDFFYTEEARELTSWGEEGVTYEVVDGKKRYIAPYNENQSILREKSGIFARGTTNWFDWDAYMSLAEEGTRLAYEEVRKYDSKLQPKVAFTDEENEIVSTIGQAVNKHKDENASKFILGTRSLDEWDQYVQEAKKLGYEQLVDVHKQAYSRVTK